MEAQNILLNCILIFSVSERCPLNTSITLFMDHGYFFTWQFGNETLTANLAERLSIERRANDQIITVPCTHNLNRTLITGYYTSNNIFIYRIGYRGQLNVVETERQAPNSARTIMTTLTIIAAVSFLSTILCINH